MALKCNTCGANLLGAEGFVQFDCPSCGQGRIVRCARCRALSVHYVCPSCGFEGP